jgi:hypothetical protein
MNDEGAYYTNEILGYFRKDGVKKYALLDIWDEEWMKRNGVEDPRTGMQKLLHKYLRSTMRSSDKFFVRAIDKVLKRFI